MNTGNIKIAIAGLAAALVTQLGVAQDTAQPQSSQPGMQPSGSEMGQTSMQSGGDVRFKKLHNTTAKSKNGQDIGIVDDVVINTQTGKIQCVVLGRGGFLGMGRKLVPVPWQTVASASEKEITLNIDSQKLQSAPTLAKNDYSQLNNPDFMAKMDQFYSGAPTAVGAPGETPGGGGMGGEQQNISTNK
jgi:sporulation protein YlmC with PRC-barrel domain